MTVGVGHVLVAEVAIAHDSFEDSIFTIYVHLAVNESNDDSWQKLHSLCRRLFRIAHHLTVFESTVRVSTRDESDDQNISDQSFLPSDRRFEAR